MKRSELKRKTPLKTTRPLLRTAPLSSVSARQKPRKGLARTQLRVKPQKRSLMPGEETWKAPHRGPCSVCRHPGPLVRHHVVEKKHIRDRALKYDMRNAMEVGVFCDCHELHTNHAKLFRRDQLPADAVAFAHQILGDYAEDYLARYDAPSRARIAVGA